MGLVVCARRILEQRVGFWVLPARLGAEEIVDGSRKLEVVDNPHFAVEIRILKIVEQTANQRAVGRCLQLPIAPALAGGLAAEPERQPGLAWLLCPWSAGEDIGRR